MVLAKKVARNVKALRLQSGLSQQDLSNKTGLTIRYISSLENESPNMTLDVLERLANGLECSIADLLGFTEIPNTKGSKDILDQAINLLESLKSRM